VHNCPKIALLAFLRNMEGCDLTQQRETVPDPHISQRLVVPRMRMTQSRVSDRFRLVRHVRKSEPPTAAREKTRTICSSRSRDAADHGLMANLPMCQIMESCFLRFGRNNDWLIFRLFLVTEPTFIDIKNELTRD
jgi:hypothetical protein